MECCVLLHPQVLAIVLRYFIECVESNHHNAFTSTCKAYKAKYDTNEYWFPLVQARFATRSVSPIILSSALEFYSTHDHFRISSSCSHSLPPLSSWKYIYFLNVWMNRPSVTPEIQKQKNWKITTGKAYAWPPRTPKEVSSRTSNLSVDPPLKLTGEYNALREFMLLLQNRIIARWPWLSASLAEKEEMMFPPFLGDRYFGDRDLPERGTSEPKVFSDLRIPAIRFVTGNMCGFAMAWTDVLEVFVISRKYRAAQGKRAKYWAALDEKWERRYERRARREAGEDVEDSEESDEDEEEDESDDGTEDTFTLELVNYVLRDDQDLDVLNHNSISIPSAGLSPELLNESHPFLIHFFEVSVVAFASFLSAFGPFNSLWDSFPGDERKCIETFHNVWRLVSSSLRNFSLELDLALETRSTSIISNTIGDVTSCPHATRCQIRQLLDNCFTEGRQESKRRKPSKTIEVAMQRCARRATRFYLKDFVLFYQWDLQDPLIALLLDDENETPGKSWHSNVSWLKENNTLFSQMRNYFTLYSGIETVMPNSVYLFPKVLLTTSSVDEIFHTKPWHYWPLGIQALALSLQPLIFAWIQTSIHALLENNISLAGGNPCEQKILEFVKQRKTALLFDMLHK